MGPYPYMTRAIFSSASNPLFLGPRRHSRPVQFRCHAEIGWAFAVNGVFIGTYRQVPVTSMVACSSAGVANHVLIRFAQVAALPEKLAQIAAGPPDPG